MNQPRPWSVEKVGNRFVEYYASLGFEQMEGGSLLSPALPMTFVMSAGMVQFEKLAPTARSGDRYVLIQNCFRHVDIERVRNSAFHISLFQMPGAFAFGPVDRPTCIDQIWQLLTKVYSFDLRSLYVTYFGGGLIEKQFISPDETTAAAWRAVGVPAANVIGLGSTDNFWRQSERMVGLVNSRKCGPNTEVFFDRGIQYGCGQMTCKPSCTCGRFVEFLNLLFICFRIDDTEQRIIPLEDAFTEVVIGCERVTALLNHAVTVYDVNTLRPLVQHIDAFRKSMPQGEDLSARYQRIIADHVRALLFLVQDGAPSPGKGGRAWLMRTLARELLTSQRLLGISDRGFLRSLTTLALDLYPHLTRQTQEELLMMLTEEQANFETTLQKGLEVLEKRLENGTPITPAEIVRMEKVRGIPFDLLSHRFWQKHISIDMPAYQAELNAYLQAAKHGSD